MNQDTAVDAANKILEELRNIVTAINALDTRLGDLAQRFEYPEKRDATPEGD